MSRNYWHSVILRILLDKEFRLHPRWDWAIPWGGSQRRLRGITAVGYG